VTCVHWSAPQPSRARCSGSHSRAALPAAIQQRDPHLQKAFHWTEKETLKGSTVLVTALGRRGKLVSRDQAQHRSEIHVGPIMLRKRYLLDQRHNVIKKAIMCNDTFISKYLPVFVYAVFVSWRNMVASI
jgi:hypothetical protein